MNVLEARIRKDGIVNPGNILKHNDPPQKTPHSRLPDLPAGTVGCFAVLQFSFLFLHCGRNCGILWKTRRRNLYEQARRYCLF